LAVAEARVEMEPAGEDIQPREDRDREEETEIENGDFL